MVKKKKTLINVNILIRISLIILHLLYFISISKPKKKYYIWLSLYVSLSISFSSTVVPPSWIDCTNFAQDLKRGRYFSVQISCLRSRKKKKNLLLQTTITFYRILIRFLYLFDEKRFLCDFTPTYQSILVSCCDLTKKTKMNLQNKD